MGCGEQSSDKASRLWYVGVILGIAGSVCTNMGVNLQKYSFICEAKKCVVDKRTYARQPLWVIGLLLVVGGSAVDFVSLGFLPQSLATPVGGSTMVANIAFASILLKEKFSRLDAVGTMLVLGGICITAAFASKHSQCYTVDELIALYSEPLFIMYLIVTLLLCIGFYYLAKKLERIKKHRGASSPAYKRFAKLHPVTYPALSGIIGAQSELFAKSTAELIKTTFKGTNQFAEFGTYAITLSMFACIFLQIHWLAHGLQQFDAVFIVPVFQCFFISVSIFGGGVYFKEFDSMSTLALVMFFIGAFVTLLGVYLLSHREMNGLQPKAKLRAAVKLVIFIKRVQKAKHMDYQWTQPSDKMCSVEAAKTGPTKPPTLKCLSAKIVPIDSYHQLPAPDASDVTTVDLDAANSVIEISPKRLSR